MQLFFCFGLQLKSQKCGRGKKEEERKVRTGEERIGNRLVTSDGGGNEKNKNESESEKYQNENNHKHKRKRETARV